MQLLIRREAKGLQKTSELAQAVMLVHCNRDIPSAAHSFGKLHQITSPNLNTLISPIWVYLHFALQQVTCLFGCERPWEFAWFTPPPVQYSITHIHEPIDNPKACINT